MDMRSESMIQESNPSLHNILLSERTFSHSTLIATEDFPKNSKFEKLIQQSEGDVRFTSKYPFSFKNMSPESHTLLLEPGEFPLPEKDNCSEFNIFRTPFAKGDQPEYENKEDFEQQLKNIAKLGNVSIPDFFLTNSSDAMPDKFHKGQVISTLFGIDRCKKPEKVIMLNLDNTKLSGVKPRKFFNKLEQFINLEVISLNSTGLSGLTSFTFPNLRICLLCDNNIDNAQDLLAFSQRHKKLAVLDYRKNPISNNDDIRLEITATNINLKTLNRRQITLRDRISAMEHFHQKFRPKDIARLHFFLQIKEIPEISVLPSWDPSMLRHLSLPSCGLTYICLHHFPMLQSLNLRDNSIEKLDESGIVYCQYLLSLDISNNKISDMAQLEVLKFLRSLLHVWVSGNKIGNYRSHLIYKCRRSCGTKALNGLQTIDGLPVLEDELIQSMVKAHPEIYQSNESIFKYKFGFQRRLGTTVIQNNNNPFEKLTSLSMCFRNLEAIDVHYFKNLTHLVLRGNKFKTVQGLGLCKNLLLLDISHNENLEITEMAEDIKQLTKLQFLMAATDCWDPQYRSVITYDQLFRDNAPPHSVTNRKHREQIIRLFVLTMPYLSSVDRVRITVQERTQVLEDNGMEKDVLDEYRCNVALAQASKPAAWLNLKVESVKQGVQYDPDKIVKLHRLTNCGLVTHPRLEFSRFIMLEDLDLSHNNLTKITTLNLTSIPNLKYVDLSYNKINETPEEVGGVIDNIKVLRMISLRGNPVINTQEKKDLLLRNISRLTNQYDTLRVIDCEVSPVKIYETHSWENARASQKPRLLYFLALKIRLPFEAKKNLITNLDLSFCNLSYCDVTKFTNLKRLILSDNEFTNSDQIVGLKDIGTVEFLDVRRNKIERLESIIFLISYCPKLKNIGMEGNPCNVENYRNIVLSTMPKIVDANNPLIAIDDCPIIAEEIKEAVNKGSIKDFDKFSFDLAISRNKDKENVLDLSNASLKTYLDLSNCKTVKLLNLRANKLTEGVLMKSNLDLCPEIEYLDISQNNINDKAVGEYLSSLNNLQRLEISKNPICQRKEDWKTFLNNYPKITDVNCKLQIINGHKLTIDERYAIVKQQTQSEETAEVFKTNYILTQESREWFLNKSIYLSNRGISSLTILSLAKSLQYLDVSNNNITTLKNQGFSSFVNLVTLDIHGNKIATIEEIRDELSNCPRLERVYMLNSTADNSLTSNPDTYVGFITNILRGLTDIDHYANPFPLKANQLNALKDIEQTTGWNNPNHIHEIDLSNRDISLKDFTATLTALQALAPRAISFEGNPCAKVKNYRFLVIYNVPDVQTIDGSQVTIDQRMNADKSIRTNTGTSKAENLIIAGALVGAEYVDKEERDSTMSMIRTFGNYAYEYAYKYGTMMMKWEIFITFQQILTLVISFIDKIKWPEIYIDFSWLFFIFSIDFSFLDYLLDIRLPFWYQYCSFFIYILIPALFYFTYHFQPNREYWNLMFTVGYHKLLWHIVYLFFVLLLMNTGLAFLADFNYTYHFLKVTNNQWAWFTVLNVMNFVLCVTLFFISRWYHKNQTSPVIWFKAMKLKKRFSLFMLTVMYFPVCKAFVDLFTCTDGHNKAFTELECFTGIENLTIVHVAAVVFGVIYAIGIPFFFVGLINKGVREIDLNYRIDVQIKQLEERKKEVKKMKDNGEDIEDEEDQIKKKEKYIKKSYAMAAIQYENAASYLYNEYDRKDRYEKVISMIEKLVYLLISSFVPKKWVESVLSVGMMFLSTVTQIVLTPYNALQENVLDGSMKTGNLATLLIGNSCQYGWFGLTQKQSNIVGIVLIIIFVVLFVMCIYFIIKTHCCHCCNKDDDFGLSSDYDDDSQSTSSEEEDEDDDNLNDDDEEEEEIVEENNAGVAEKKEEKPKESPKAKDAKGRKNSKIIERRETKIEEIKGLTPLTMPDNDSSSESNLNIEEFSDSDEENQEDVQTKSSKQIIETLDSI